MSSLLINLHENVSKLAQRELLLYGLHAYLKLKSEILGVISQDFHDVIEFKLHESEETINET